MPERPPSQATLGDFERDDPAEGQGGEVHNTSNSDRNYTERVNAIQERGERALE
jgi:hypothetical protein